MKINNFFLFSIPALIWGTTWYAIKFQLGTVNPLLSVAYRFAIAGVLLLIICRIFKLNLKFSLKSHFYILLQGLSLFSINYWLVYFAELNLTSGLVAIVFSLIIFLNIFFNSIILKASLRKEVLIGGILGFAGTLIIFQNEFRAFSLSDSNFFALILCLISVVLASLGNITSAYNQKNKLPVIQTNAFGMTYGSIFTFIVALIAGKEFSFDLSASYIISLGYLALLGSIVAFGAYLKLIGNIGPDRASYIILIVPLIAITVSVLFEDYNLHKSAIIGIVLLISGNFMAMNKRININKIRLWK
ncbi:MAG: EamA family transporter [Bacteroidales bacterium]|nr:MAG: EamA family transporter [Bacteroidales bacterium]